MMRKRWILGIALAGILGLSSCGITIQTGGTGSISSVAPSEASSSQEPAVTTIQPVEPSSSPTATFLTEEQAKELVLNHAGVSANATSFMNVELERDDGKMCYEIEFRVERVEYQYEIDATTGDIISYEKDNH